MMFGHLLNYWGARSKHACSERVDYLASGIAVAAFLRTAQPNNFTPDTALPWVLSNTATKCPRVRSLPKFFPHTLTSRCKSKKF